MQELRKRMRILAAELQVAEQRFTDQCDALEAADRALLELQKRLDHLRKGIWEARKLTDPRLMSPHFEPGVGHSATLAERILLFVDSQKKSA
jgi:hypothetical protein